jgi:hypothetical protein
MHLLPTHLAPLADIAAKSQTGRFALEVVHLRVHGDNTFIAEATDTKVLLRVTGPCVGPAEEYPEHPGMTTATNGSSEALIPEKAWAKAFSNGEKVTKKQKSQLKSVAVKMSKEIATFGATNLDSYPVEQTRLVEGRFPPATDIIDQTRKHVTVSFRVDPIYMARALKVISAVGCDEENRAVEILINTNDVNKPFMIRADERSDGIKAEAIVMPLETEKKKNQESETDVTPNIDQLREELEKLKGERDFLNEELAKARHRIEELNADAERLLQANERLQEVLEGRENQITELVRQEKHEQFRNECDRPITQPVQTVRSLSRRERLQRVGIPS